MHQDVGVGRLWVLWVILTVEMTHGETERDRQTETERETGGTGRQKGAPQPKIQREAHALRLPWVGQGGGRGCTPAPPGVTEGWATSPHVGITAPPG